MLGREIPIYILAGGQSSRFGSDKARAMFRGETLLKRIVNALEPCASAITVIAQTGGKYVDLGVRTLADEFPGKGPMAGLHAALKDLKTPGWLLLVSCDFVAIDVAWAETLWAARGDLQAVAFRGERVEPLFALYHSSLLMDVEGRIQRGELSPSKLLESVNSKILPLPKNWPFRAHVNTPDELAASARLEF